MANQLIVNGRTSSFDTLSNLLSSGNIVSGAVIKLSSGNHGSANISGFMNSAVTITALAGAKPMLNRLTFINASNWVISNLSIGGGGIVIDNQTNEKSHHITIDNCTISCFDTLVGLTARQMQNLRSGITLYGSNHTITQNHIKNGTGIMVGYHSNNNYIAFNTIENVISDGMHVKGNNNIVEYNLVKDIYKVNGNHNDLTQVMASTGNIFRNNIYVSYTDANRAYKTVPCDFQGIGMFDGFYTNITVENNIVFVDHPIGVWIQGAIKCTVKNNYVSRCGNNAYIKTNLPSVKILPKKSGASSLNNTVINNYAENIVVTQTGGSSVGNIKIKPRAQIPKSILDTFVNFKKIANIQNIDLSFALDKNLFPK